MRLTTYFHRAFAVAAVSCLLNLDSRCKFLLVSQQAVLMASGLWNFCSAAVVATGRRSGLGSRARRPRYPCLPAWTMALGIGAPTWPNRRTGGPAPRCNGTLLLNCSTTRTISKKGTTTSSAAALTASGRGGKPRSTVIRLPKTKKAQPKLSFFCSTESQRAA